MDVLGHHGGGKVCPCTCFEDLAFMGECTLHEIKTRAEMAMQEVPSA